MNQLCRRPRARGFTLVEAMVAMLIGALVIAGLTGVVSGALAVRADEEERIEATRTAEFALGRMARAVGRTTALVLPLPEDPGTAYSEAVRDPGVLAVVLDPDLDRDRDGIADADNDGDGLVDEDPSGDRNGDSAAGLAGLDDDNDGQIDEAHGGSPPPRADDDEDGQANEDDPDGLDDDGDGAVDEDTRPDLNGDGQPGVAGVDDDNDTQVDEGDQKDDDEDGAVDEDWIDTVAWFLSGTDLVERMPDLGASAGTDYTERVIASNVATFRVERLPFAAGARAVVVVLRLDVTGAAGDTVSFTTRARVGGRR